MVPTERMNGRFVTPLCYAPRRSHREGEVGRNDEIGAAESSPLLQQQSLLRTLDARWRCIGWPLRGNTQVCVHTPADTSGAYRWFLKLPRKHESTKKDEFPFRVFEFSWQTSAEQMMRTGH